MFRKFALLLMLAAIGGIVPIAGVVAENRGKDIGATAAIHLANVSLRTHLVSVNHANTRRGLTLEQLLRDHSLTVERSEQPENACLYEKLYAGLMALDQQHKARDLDIQKRLSAKTYYLIMYAPAKATFDGGRYCIYVEAPTGKILWFEALLG